MKLSIFNGIKELMDGFEASNTYIILTESRKFFILKNKKTKIIDLQFMYLDNQNPESFFENSSTIKNEYILEQAFEHHLNGKEVQFLSFNDNQFGMNLRNHKNNYEELGTFIEQYGKNGSLILIAFEEQLFYKILNKIPIKAGCNLYNRISNMEKNDKKDIIFVDLGYKLLIKTKEGRNVCDDFNITNIIIKFREFLNKTFKINISNYKSGKILKSLKSLNESYYFYSLGRSIEIQSHDLKSFFIKKILRNFDPVEYKEEEEGGEVVIYILDSFFNEKTTIDLLYLMFKKKINKKRKREQKINFFLYGFDLTLSESIIKKFLSKTSVSVNNDYYGKLLNLFEINITKVLEFLLFLKQNKYEEFLDIDPHLIVFISLKVNKMIFNEKTKVKKLIDTYNQSKIDKDLLNKKNIFQILNDPQKNSFFKNLVEDRLFYYLKCNTFFLFGKQFLDLKKQFIKTINEKFSLIKNNMKKCLNKEDFDYFQFNCRFFTDLTYIPKNGDERKIKKRKIK
jgi:hypothetical protein